MKLKIMKKVIVTFLAISVFVSCNTTQELTEGVKDVTYTTITEAFDWGPAITKVVLDFGGKLDQSTVSTDLFDVVSVRNFKDFDFSTFKLNPEATDHEANREILAAYVSDKNGNESKKGNFVCLELRVGPSLSEGSPYNYEMTSGFNVLVNTIYKVSMHGSIQYKGGQNVTINTTGDAQNTGNINLIADDFENNVKFEFDDIKLGYASYSPKKSNKDGSTPLVIWLHGAGEGGTNTLINIMGNKVVNLATEEIQTLFGSNGSYILAPQSPTMWMDVDGTKVYNTSVPENTGTSYYTEALMALINDYVAQNSEIDTNRIYLGGCSNGGYMTINMLMSYPGYFAAAYPSATPFMPYWITNEKLQAIIDTPIWFTHAKTDGTVAIYDGESDPKNFMVYNLNKDEEGNDIPLDSNSNFLFNLLTSEGATNVHYSLFNKVEDTSGNYFQADGITPYEYMGHWSWLYTLNNESTDMIDGKNISVFQWLAQQSK